MAVFEIIVGILFVMMGGMKLKGAMSGNKGLKSEFKKLGVSFNVVYLISIIEVIGGLALIFSKYMAEVQWVLLVLMAGATLSHWRVKDFKGSTMALAFLVLVVLLIVL